MKDLESTYRTVEKRSEGLYKEKGSKFIGIAVACYNEEAAKKFIDDWKKEHHQARHLCYAYRFGLDGQLYRANDDGEPNNSAGQPILGQIDSFDLTNILIGVVRYYGGTKLGVGGLINAYRSAAKEALSNANVIQMEVFRWIRLQFGYEDMPSIMSAIKRFDLQMIDSDFAENCSLKLNLPLNKAEAILTELNEFGSSEIIELGIY